MAKQIIIKKSGLELPVLVRIAKPECEDLWKLIFSRYPYNEWGTFAKIGWRETPMGLVLTINSVDAAIKGDLDEESEITEIQSQYTRRILRLLDDHPFGVCFVHSHPQGYNTYASKLDYNMEAYYADLLKGYAPNRPFLSLIFAKEGDKISGSGRVWWKNQWFEVTKFALEGASIIKYNFDEQSFLSPSNIKRISRLVSVFGLESAQKLAGSTVGVVGLSGTGSPVVELLARAGVGHLILVDPKLFDESNLERTHGSEIDDIKRNTKKCLIAKRHVLSINPKCKITVIQGRLPQKEVLDRLIWTDLIFGCTDLHSSRVALTEISYRFLVPVIDIGVCIEGKDGNITGQVIQINRLFPNDPCVYCREMVSSQIILQELMTHEEQELRKKEARKDEHNSNAYWIDLPQLNTVGYLTTMAGSMATGFGIGYLTNRFSMYRNRLELSFTKKGTQTVEKNVKSKAMCLCQSSRGVADQDPMAILCSPALHWNDPIIFD